MLLDLIVELVHVNQLDLDLVVRTLGSFSPGVDTSIPSWPLAMFGH
jgi:hypothetical protein